MQAWYVQLIQASACTFCDTCPPVLAVLCSTARMDLFESAHDLEEQHIEEGFEDGRK
jgi:hypothetical protein